MAGSHISTSLPMITVSAHAMTEDIHKALDRGFDSYLTQPVDIPTFLKTMDHYLKKARPLPESVPFVSLIFQASGSCLNHNSLIYKEF